MLKNSIFDFQSKVGCTSKIKINTNLFGILLGLDKFLTCVIRPIPVHFLGALQSPNEA